MLSGMSRYPTLLQYNTKPTIRLVICTDEKTKNIGLARKIVKLY